MTSHPIQSASDRCTACVLQRVQPRRRHWLLDTLYGRELLKAKLRQVYPLLRVPQWSELPELEPLLDDMIDELGLRDWQRPRGFAARLRYLRKVVAAGIRIDSGHCGYDFQLEDEPVAVPAALTHRGRA